MIGLVLTVTFLQMFVISFVALFVIIYNVYGFRLDLLPVCLDGIL